MSPRSRTGRRGFTLLEVMVAMSVLAIGLVVAFEVVGGALHNHVRARDLELATLLARGKLADVQARFDLDGFRDFEETDEGTFEADGHGEIRWEMKTVKPTVELGAEGVVKALTGADGGLEGLLSMASPSGSGAGGSGGQGGLAGLLGGAAGAGGASGAGGSPGASGSGAAGSPLAGPALALINQQLATLGEEIKRGVREVRLTVSWPDGRSTESFTVVTHMVILGSAAERAQNSAAQTLQQVQGALLGQGIPGVNGTPIVPGTRAGTVTTP
jgi:general secretion pathway protein I